MALNIPSFPDPRDPANPITNAYGFIAEVTFSWIGESKLTINISPNAAAWTGAPVDQIRVKAGEILAPAQYDNWQSPDRKVISPEVRYPTFEQLMADPEFAQAFAVIGGKLQTALAGHPRLAGATNV